MLGANEEGCDDCHLSNVKADVWIAWRPGNQGSTEMPGLALRRFWLLREFPFTCNTLPPEIGARKRYLRQVR